MLTDLAQLVLNGLMAGAILATPAIGFTAIYAVLRFPNFAVASHATIGAFAGYCGNVWLGLPLLLAFSAGLAGVLVAIGILVVKAKGFAGSHWGESRLFKALPVVSAALIACMGLWLCYDSIHPTEPSPGASVPAITKAP